MPRRPYLQHARRHGPGGSDTIGDGFVVLSFDNEGGYFYLVANESTDGDFGTLGVLIADRTADGVQIVSVDGTGPPQASVLLTPTSLTLAADQGGTEVAIGLGSSEAEITIGGDPVLRIGADGDLHIKTGASVVADL